MKGARMHINLGMVSLCIKREADTVFQGIRKTWQTSASKQSIRVEFISDPLKELEFQFHHNDRDMNDGNFYKSGASIKEFPFYFVNVAKCLLGLRSSFIPSKVETLIYIIRQEFFDVSRFREYACSVADCNRMTKSAWKRYLLRAEFEREEINTEKDVLYKKNTVEVLRGQLQIANVD